MTAAPPFMIPPDLPRPPAVDVTPVLDFARLRVTLTAQGLVDVVHSKSGRSVLRLDATDACSLIGAVAAAVGAHRSGLERIEPAVVAEASVEAVAQ